MPKIRVALVDDHQLVRDGIKALLRSTGDIDVVAEAGDGREAIALADKAEIDVLIMDIAMAGLNGLDATKRIVDKNPKARIIILSMYDSEEYVVRSMHSGARGYLVKNMAPKELELAIRKVASGGVYLSPAIGDAMRSQLLKQAPASGSIDALTPRQREILQAVAEGLSTRAIADLLSISPKTVETHRSQLMQKLDIHDVPGLVRYAIRHGLISVG
ncbi:MAG: response regulator transcription factor [Gammaproteobacteria bacterium]|nr:response regulator transcription factor [Gammaproteobacteria bacterium]